MNDKNFERDKASNDVSQITSKFIFGEFEKNNLMMPYRIYCPLTDQKVPLVIYLHGAGVNGTDNVKQIEHNTAIVFAKKEWQDNHPCFILAPQCPQGKAWEIPEIQSVLKLLIDSIIDMHTTIDTNRIYLYGCSMGSIGGLQFIKNNSKYLGGAILICGATSFDDLHKLMHTPIWLFHAKDDNNVRCDTMRHPLYGIDILGSASIYDKLTKMGKGDVYYTEYPMEYIHQQYGVKSHCAWIPAFETTKAQEWLFSLKKI